MMYYVQYVYNWTKNEKNERVLQALKSVHIQSAEFYSKEQTERFSVATRKDEYMQ